MRRAGAEGFLRKEGTEIDEGYFLVIEDCLKLNKKAFWKGIFGGHRQRRRVLEEFVLRGGFEGRGERERERNGPERRVEEGGFEGEGRLSDQGKEGRLRKGKTICEGEGFLEGFWEERGFGETR